MLYSTLAKRLLVAIALLTILGASMMVAELNYLLFHSLVELFSIIVAGMTGVVAWYTFRFSRNHFLSFLGLAYPAIAVLDLLHTLAYQGMGVFADGANLSTQLWIAGRSVEAAALLLAPAFLYRKVRIGYAAVGIALVPLVLLTLISAGLFPTMYVEGQGLTTTKVFSEYVIIAVLALAGARLWQGRRRLDPRILDLVLGALALTMLAELLFTFYVGVYDLANMLGHLAKLASFGLIYIGLIRTSLEQPFRILSRNNTTYDAIPEEIIVVDEAGRIRQVNGVVEQRHGKDALLGKSCHPLFHPPASAGASCPVCNAIALGTQQSFELFYPDEGRWRLITLAPIRDPLAARGMVQMTRDVTDIRHAEVELRRLNRALRAISASNHTLIHATDERELIQAVCGIVVEKGGYRMAWVGFPDEGPDRQLVPRVWAGEEQGYLSSSRISWGDNPLGLGPAGTAIRTGQPRTVNDIEREGAFDPWKDEARRCGFAAVMAFPLLDHRQRAFGVLVIYSEEANVFSREEITILGELAGDLAYGIQALRTGKALDDAEQRAQHWYRELASVLKKTVAALAGMVEMRDPYTAGHQRRVAELAVAIGRELKLDEQRLEGLYIGGLMHDIGKLQVPAEILARPGKLTSLELALIKVHPAAGYELLRDITFPWPIAEMVHEHHERLDGSGYPQGLMGAEIRLESRILAVADVVEAISSHRPYRPSLGLDAARAELEKHAGTLYDTEAVRACLKIIAMPGFSWSARVPGGGAFQTHE